MLEGATIHFYCLFDESRFSNICTIMELKELNWVNLWKTSEAANLVFQWIFSVKHKFFHVSIVTFKCLTCFLNCICKYICICKSKSIYVKDYVSPPILSPVSDVAYIFHNLLKNFKPVQLTKYLLVKKCVNSCLLLLEKHVATKNLIPQTYKMPKLQQLFWREVNISIY